MLLKVLEAEQWHSQEVESALAEYLPAAFLKSSHFANSDELVSFFVTLENNTLYPSKGSTSVSRDGVGDWYQRGVVWAGALWACRQKVGQRSVDDLVLPAGRQVNSPPIQPDLVPGKFGAVLASAPPPLGPCFTEEISRRRLPRDRAR